MLAYAVHRRPAGASASPATLAIIVGAHAVALGLVLTAKPELIARIPIVDTDIFNVPLDPPPPPPPPPPETREHPQPPTKSTITASKPIVVVPSDGPVTADDPRPVDLNPFPGNSEVRLPPSDPPKPLFVARTAARFATPEELVRPPYPPSKQRLEEEASLRLRLSIDERGRVVAVDPIGATDPEFLAAARKHILKHWRYKPATLDGAAVASRTELTLKFELDE
jgi:protein TonB